MKIKVILSLAAFSLGVQAATIDFSLATDTGAATDSDVALNTSYTLYFGTYTGGALGPTATFTDINSSFDILTSVQFASGAAAGANGYALIPAFVFDDTAGFAGDPVYVWFSDGGDNNALLTGFGNIPADADVPSSVSFFLDSSNAAGLTYVLGSYDPASPNLAGSGGNVILNNAIPEPSVALLGALGVLGLIRRRR